MKTLKFICTADWHADSDLTKHEKLVDSLTQMLDYVKANEINAIIHAGDIWEKKQSYAEKSGVPMVVQFLRDLSKHVDFIFITKGNNSHDEPGSVALLHQLEPNIYAYEYPVVLGIRASNDEPAIDMLREEERSLFAPDYIVSLVPYPSKAGFITETSIDNNNADFLEKFEQVFELISDVTQPCTCSKILAFHGNVVGSRLSTGQTLVSQDVMVAPSTLQKANHDYYALGHIHLRQAIKPNMVYSGSIYNKNWGEVEQKSFEIIEFEKNLNDDWDFESKQIMLTSAKPMIKIEASYHQGAIIPEAEFEKFGYWDSKPSEAEYRIRIKVSENDRKLLNENLISELKERFGSDVKIEFNIIPDARESRSEKIMNCNSLLDEVIEYATVIEHELPESIKSKVLSLTHEEVLV